jgi:Stress responsive A/B Barrel Domain
MIDHARHGPAPETACDTAPMIRHIVTFRWKPETTADDIAAVEAGLRELPAAIPQIQRYTFGRDVGINDGNFQFAVVADFASADDYVVYRDDAQHRSLIDERIRPHIAERVAIQFEVT